MNKNHKYWALIPAAGAGNRMESDVPKQYLKINKKTILEHTVEKFCNHPKIDGVIVVIANTDSYWTSLTISSHSKIKIAPGGDERCHSVLSGLRSLYSFAKPYDWVLVHDAARPCIHSEDIDRLIDQLSDHPVGGLLAIPVRDTMKRADNKNEITETIERDNLWHALTPQMFRLESLRDALEKSLANGCIVTDEAMAIELTGSRPMLIRGRRENIKITQMDDILLAELYLK